MEVEKGYKQTEVGIIPEDWEKVQLQAILSGVIDNRGKTPPLSSEGYPLIEVNSIYGGNKYPDYKKITKFVDEETYDNWFRDGHPKKGDLLIATVGSTGASAIMDNTFGCIAQNIIGLKISPANCSDFFYYVTNTEVFQSQVRAVLMGAVQPSLKRPHLLKFAIIRPPFPEQTAIATVLSDADALISSLEKLIAKKRNIRQGTMQQLLTCKKRLPGFTGEWETKRLGDMGTFKGGSGFPLKYQGEVEGDYPFFKVSDMNNEGNLVFMSKSNNWITEAVRKKIGGNIFFSNTIVFAKIGAAIFLERKKILSRPSIIDNNMMGFIYDEKTVHFRFLHYLFLNIQLGKLVNTTALPSLNGKDIAKLQFKLPKFAEQTAIAHVLSDMDAEIEALERKLGKYRLIKQGMMQELLTGKKRLI